MNKGAIKKEVKFVCKICDKDFDMNNKCSLCGDTLGDAFYWCDGKFHYCQKCVNKENG